VGIPEGILGQQLSKSWTGATEQANAKRQLLLGEKDRAKFNQSSRQSSMALSWGWDPRCK